MAKLVDLKKLVDAARANAAAAQRAEPRTRRRRAARRSTRRRRRRRTPTPTSPARQARGRRRRPARPSPTSSACRRRPSTHRRPRRRRSPRQRIADERGRAARVEVRRRAGAAHAGTSARSTRASRRSCAAASAPTSCGKLRRGHWSVQGEIDLHGLTDRRGARRAGRFPRRRAQPRLPLRARDPRQGPDLAEPGAGAQGQGARVARALGRGARVLRGAAPRRRRRRGVVLLKGAR